MSSAAAPANAIAVPQLAEARLSPNARAWRRFRKNRPAIISLGIFTVLLALVLFLTRVDLLPRTLSSTNGEFLPLLSISVLVV